MHDNSIKGQNEHQNWLSVRESTSYCTTRLKCNTWDRSALAQRLELEFCKAGVGGGCETHGRASLKRVELALVLKKVGGSVVCGGNSKVRRCCIDRPRQSFDYGVMGVNHPASGF